MDRPSVKRASVALFATLALVSSTPVRALVYHIDSFSEGTATGAFFVDAFSDGTPPPSAPNFLSGTPATYTVFGAFAPTAETGGKLAIDTSLGIFNAPFGIPVRALDTTLVTGGLTQDLNFFVQGRFDLSQLPVRPLDYVGLRVGDHRGGDGNGVVELLLRMEFDLQIYIQVRELDFPNGTASVVYSTAFAPLLASFPTADQIDFTLGHAPGDTQLGAAFALFASGSSLYSTLLPGSAGNLFDGETTVRGGFIGVATVPEPSTLLLLGIALATLGFTRRRQNWLLSK